MEHRNSETQYAVCIKNEGYPASLEIRKIYQIIHDVDSAEHQLVRIVDESGEDYLYPADYFVSIELPQALVEVLSVAG